MSLIEIRQRKPPKLTPEIEDELWSRLADRQSLVEICNDKRFPARCEIYRWIAESPDFANSYARAREAQGLADADEIAIVVEEIRAGDLTPDVGRVVIDGLKWTAGRRAGKWNSERREITGPNGGPIQTENRQVVNVDNLTPDQRDQLRQLLSLAAVKSVETDIIGPDIIEGELVEDDNG